ncbi:MAG: FHA domain-containing protein [Acidimicrobiales bacterium]
MPADGEVGPALTVVVLPSGPELTFGAGGAGVVVGRDPAADVVLAESCVSRRHAGVRQGGDGRWVWEDTSSGGTFRGAERVTHVVLDEPLVVRLGHPTKGPELRLLAAGEVVDGGAPAAMDVTGEGAAVHGAWSASVDAPPVGAAGVPAQAPRSAGPSMPQVPGRIGRAEGAGSIGAGSVGFAPPSQLHQPAARTRIGRADDNDIVVADLLVSRHHAELRPAAGGYDIADLDSHKRNVRRRPPDQGTRAHPGGVRRERRPPPVPAVAGTARGVRGPRDGHVRGARPRRGRRPAETAR